VDREIYNDDEEASIDVDFATLHPTDNSLLQAALAFPGIGDNGVSSLRILLNPPLLGPRFHANSVFKPKADYGC
jgi:hypothetical protein